MKKLIALFAVIALTAPVFAQETVTLTLVDETGGVIRVDYDASSASALMSGLAFNVEVDGGATIEAITDFKTGESTAASPGYGIFLGSIDLTDPQVPVWGDPVAPSDAPSALGGLGTSGITVELGALYDQAVPGDAPLTSGMLFKLEVDCKGADPVNMTVTAEPTRAGHAGGAVLEPATEGGDPIPADIVCAGLEFSCGGELCPIGGTALEQAKWLEVGSPMSWCDDCWLQGDIKPPHDGFVDFADVSAVFAEFKTLAGGYNADYDANMDGFLDFADVSRVFNQFKTGATCP